MGVMSTPTPSPGARPRWDATVEGRPKIPRCSAPKTKFRLSLLVTIWMANQDDPTALAAATPISDQSIPVREGLRRFGPAGL